MTSMDRFARLFAIITALLGVVVVSAYAPSAQTCADLTSEVWAHGGHVTMGNYAECVVMQAWHN